MTTRTLTRAEPSFITCDPTNRHSLETLETNEHNFTYWSSVLDELDRDDDFQAQVANLAMVKGMPESTIIDYLTGVDDFRKLPKSLAVFHKLRHLTLWHMAKISEVISGLPAERLAEADDLLAEIILPTRANQQLPPPWRVAHRLREKLGLEKNTAPPAEQRVRVDTETGYTQAGISPEGAVELDKAIKNIKASEHCTDSEAFEALIRRQVKAKITLNLFSTDGKTPIYLDGFGDLEGYQQRFWAGRITTTRDLKGAENLVVDGHDPTGIIALVVRLRDGHCAYPGCQVKAEQCQIHHVIEHELGGPTTVTNLACLCQRHHNMVTSGNVRMFMRHWGQTVWFFPDGTKVTSDPDGPLADSDRVRWLRPYEKWRQTRTPKCRPKPTAPPPPAAVSPWDTPPPEGMAWDEPAAPPPPPPTENTGWWELNPELPADPEATWLTRFVPPDPAPVDDTAWWALEPDDVT